MRKAGIMSDPVAQRPTSQGRDAAHRAHNLETHLTHVCIQLFRRFSRLRSDSAFSRPRESAGFPPRVETADRSLRGGGQ